MKVVRGMEILTSVAEIVDPTYCALLVVDMQRDFCTDEGVSGRAGRDLAMIKKAIANARTVLGAARAAGVLPVHIQNIWLPGLRSVSGPWLRFAALNCPVDLENGWTVLGTPGAAIIDELVPMEGEIVVQKLRSSAFFGTGLASILRANGIRSVVCAGVVTEGCLESTARDAVINDFYTVVLDDCVGSFERTLHEAALTVLAARCDVVPCARVLGVWSEAAARGSAAASVPTRVPVASASSRE